MLSHPIQCFFNKTSVLKFKCLICFRREATKVCSFAWWREGRGSYTRWGAGTSERLLSPHLCHLPYLHLTLVLIFVVPPLHTSPTPRWCAEWPEESVTFTWYDFLPENIGIDRPICCCCCFYIFKFFITNLFFINPWRLGHDGLLLNAEFVLSLSSDREAGLVKGWGFILKCFSSAVW